MWRALHLLAPDAASAAGLRPTYTEYASSRPYPATLGPAANLTATALRAAMRDYFQDTPFDQTDGFAAGAFGSPARFRVPPELAAEGNWERPIAVSRTIVSYVAVCRGLPPPAGGVLKCAPLRRLGVGGWEQAQTASLTATSLALDGEDGAALALQLAEIGASRAAKDEAEAPAPRTGTTVPENRARTPPSARTSCTCPCPPTRATSSGC